MQAILHYLKKIAFDNDIAYATSSELSPYSPSIAVSDSRVIVVNENWHNHQELPFIVAHELSHLLNNDSGVLYYSTTTSRSKIEQSANSRAVDLLLEYAHETDTYTGNYVQFMEQFGIPSKFEELVQSKI